MAHVVFDRQPDRQTDRQTDRQNNSIDLFKFIMAVAVVAIHTNPLADCRNATLGPGPIKKE